MPPDAGRSSGLDRTVRTTSRIAAVAALVALLGLLALLRPVSTPTQDCGLAGAFLLDGRTDVFIDPTDPPEGVTAEQAEDNNERPCRTRVVEVARVPALAVVVGTAVGLVAGLVEVVVRLSARQRARHRQHQHQPR
jgi:uncharacterized membrane protein HdeD (DUF308 family)